MLQNYFTIALRHLSRNKAYSFINIFGLAIGLTCFILIATYVLFELSYDNFQEKRDQIFRLSLKAVSNGEVREVVMTPTAAYPAFNREFPEVVTGVRIYDVSGFSPIVVNYEDRLFEERGFLYADSTFFDMFSFKVLRGNPNTLLDDINTVVLTESAAKKYFGDEDPLDKAITANGTRAFKVTGIVADPPANSQIKFSFIASFHSLENWREEIWSSANFITYLQLSDPKLAKPLEAKIRTYVNKALGGQMNDNNYLTYLLQPMRDVHLRARVEGGIEPGSDIRYVYIFSAIALLILAIACINYMNLSTARAAERAREVGVRKVIGALHNQLFQQFLGESTLVTFSALLLGLFGAYLLMPTFNQLTNREMTFVFLENPSALAGLIGIGLLVSLIAGSYPALMLSGFQPIRVLKGDFKTSGGGVQLRKALVVFQFAVSIFLIVGTIVVQNQLAFIQNRKLGYNKDQVLVLPTDNIIRGNLERFKNEFEAIPNVQSVALATETPTFIKGGYSIWAEGYPEGFSLSVNAVAADKDFVPTLGMNLLQGSNFSDADFADVNQDSFQLKKYKFILNESAAAKLGWKPEDAVGKRANLNGRQGEIKAVVEDFHFVSMHEAIGPLVIFIDNVQLNKIMLKLSGDNLSSTISALENKWKTLAPHRPFDYQFLDEEFDVLYSTEKRTGSIAATFAGLAIFIACLGLFGLTAFAAQQRTKEIGVRKVLGATIMDIVTLLSKDFLLLVAISMLIAFPAAWWAMNNWLEAFVYRINVSWWIFALAGFGALAIALLTVSSQAIRAANTNPVESLRSE
ncbi:MAG: FtsX-like permease family protein [Saprospiraceae bacterium]|nr:FtsX-like permease family protein [Saprospiraceae bacterium]